jgi:hypothetical protein
MVANTSYCRALVAEPADDLGAPAFFDEGAFGQVGGPHPDAVPHWDAVDREQCVEVVFEAADRGRVFAPVGVDQPVGGGAGRVQGGRVAHRIQVRHDLRGRLIWQLGSDVGQPMDQ